MSERAPVVYVTDLTFDRFDASDLFDLAALLRSSEHRLAGVCFAESNGGGDRVLDALALLAAPGGVMPPIGFGWGGLAKLIAKEEGPVNLVVVSSYALVAQLRDEHPELVTRAVARIFIVGGHANDYRGVNLRLPIAPRLRQRFPDLYSARGDLRLSAVDRTGWARLLSSGEAVIFVPRDISLWSYGAAGVLAGGGPTCDFLLRELFYLHLGASRDRYEAAGKPALLSTLPALLLAVKPDPFVWMRLFRVTPARIEMADDDSVAEIDPASESPNLYIVTAVDGQALSAVLTALLRDGARKPDVQ